MASRGLTVSPRGQAWVLHTRPVGPRTGTKKYLNNKEKRRNSGLLEGNLGKCRLWLPQAKK